MSNLELERLNLNGDYPHAPELSTANQPEIVDLLLENSPQRGRHVYLDAIYGLHEHMFELLARTDYHDRNRLAVLYSEQFREELEIDEAELTPDQQATLALSRVYLSAVNSTAHLRQLMYTKRWFKRKAPETQEAKNQYLEARKRFQDDVDVYYEQFAEEHPQSVNDALYDLTGMARLAASNQRWVNAEADSHNHVFLGSVLSERVVRVSLQENVHPGARYGTAEEDRSPTKADVVLPLSEGDLHVQVKMKWMEPTKLDTRPQKKPFHAIVPMHVIRGALTKREGRKLARSVMRVAEAA